MKLVRACLFVILALLAFEPAYATVSTQTSSTITEGNGATTSFAYGFNIPSASDAVVTVLNTTVTPNTITTLSATQYTITGIGNATGGVVTYPITGSPLAAGYYLTISRIVPLIQTTSIKNQGPTFAAIEGALDYLTYEVQQLEAALLAIQAGTLPAPPSNVSGREIVTGNTDTAISTINVIMWNSATTSNKTENLYQCNSTVPWVNLTIYDEIGSAATYPINVTPFSGDDILGGPAAQQITTNYGWMTLTCNGHGNWAIQK